MLKWKKLSACQLCPEWVRTHECCFHYNMLMTHLEFRLSKHSSHLCTGLKGIQNAHSCVYTASGVSASLQWRLRLRLTCVVHWCCCCCIAPSASAWPPLSLPMLSVMPTLIVPALHVCKVVSVFVAKAWFKIAQQCLCHACKQRPLVLCIVSTANMQLIRI